MNRLLSFGLLLVVSAMKRLVSIGRLPGVGETPAGGTEAGLRAVRRKASEV
jgi:hypothetical protein